jgi:hypothetical protein
VPFVERYYGVLPFYRHRFVYNAAAALHTKQNRTNLYSNTMTITGFYAVRVGIDIFGIGPNKLYQRRLVMDINQHTHTNDGRGFVFSKNPFDFFPLCGNETARMYVPYRTGSVLCGRCVCVPGTHPYLEPFSIQTKLLLPMRLKPLQPEVRGPEYYDRLLT